MRIKFPLKYVFNPAAVVLVTALMSAGAWCVPSFGVLRKGFAHPVQPTLVSLSIIAAWYGCISCSFYLGERVGTLAARRVPIDSRMFDIDDRRYLLIFTAFTLAGLVASYYKIFSVLSPALALQQVVHHKANDLKYALYSDYSAGVLSLRYLVVFSAPLAARWYLAHRKLSFIVLLNVIMLLLISLLSARLLLVAALSNALFTLYYHRNDLQIKLVRVAVAVALFFSVLSVLNATRNGDDYAKRHLSFWGAGFSEIIKYLGSPFQVSLGAAQRMDEAVNVPAETYRSYVDIQPDLTTNSAFIFLHEKLGYRAWSYIAALCVCMGCAFGFCAGHGRTVFLLTAGAILYAAAELWRLDLFREGVFMTWVVSGITLPILANSFHPLRRKATVPHA